MQQKLKAFTESKQFQMFFIAVIFLSGVVVGTRFVSFAVSIKI